MDVNGKFHWLVAGVPNGCFSLILSACISLHLFCCFHEVNLMMIAFQTNVMVGSVVVLCWRVA